MKDAVFHPAVLSILHTFPKGVTRILGKVIFDLQQGQNLTMPLSRPMPSIVAGAQELRVKERSGAYRVFYLARLKNKVFIFPAFQKKTQKTSRKEIDTTASFTLSNVPDLGLNVKNLRLKRACARHWPKRHDFPLTVQIAVA